MQAHMLTIDDPRLGIRDKADLDNPAFGPYLWHRPTLHRKLQDGALLRIYRASLGLPYTVQLICNPGVRDRRRRAESQERREVLLQTHDRGAAVEFFNTFKKC